MKGLKVLWHGVDTAKVGYLVHWPAKFQETLETFKNLRECAQAAANLQMGHYHHFRNPDELFLVRPMGARMLPYAFERGGMILFFGNTLAPWQHGKAITPNVRIEFQPLAVACHGLDHVHRQASQLLQDMGGLVVGNQLSELHMTCDVATDRPHRPSDYHASLDELWRKVRTRIRTNGQEHEVDLINMRMDTTGTRLKQVNIGKDKKMLRVYDKLLELVTHPDKIFEALLWNSPDHLRYLGLRDTGATPPSAVMRVEFQQRRERLLERCVSTVEEYLAKQGGMWCHLTEEFVAMIENDDANRSRCTTQSWWQLVQHAWDEHPACELPKRPTTMPSLDKYVDQAMGLLLAMGARIEGATGLTLEDILSILQTSWEAKHPESWESVMADKKEKLSVLWAQLEARQQPPDPVTEAGSAAHCDPKM